jgi:hypothetical protein
MASPQPPHPIVHIHILYLLYGGGGGGDVSNCVNRDRDGLKPGYSVFTSFNYLQ